MKIAILGSNSQCGKDTAAEIFAQALGLKFISSSAFCAEKIVYPALKNTYKYKSVEECIADKANHRQEWGQIIARYSADDKSKLTREILQVADIYVGCRNYDELAASRHLFDLIIWVEARKRLGQPEQYTFRHVELEQAHLVISNNGTEEVFRANCQSIADSFGKPLYELKTKMYNLITGK